MNMNGLGFRPIGGFFGGDFLGVLLDGPDLRGADFQNANFDNVHPREINDNVDLPPLPIIPESEQTER